MKSLPTHSYPHPSRRTGRVQAKSESLAVLGTAAILLALSAPGASGTTTILNNSFDSVTPGTYSGTAGASFGATTTLGNATYLNNATVSSTGGVGNTARYSATEMGVRSRVGTWDFENTTEFSMYFKHSAGSSNTYTEAYVAAGWALAAGTDGSNYYSSNSDSRFLVGLMGPSGATNYGTAQFAAIGSLTNRTALSGSPTMTLTVDHWYKLSFGLDFDGTNSWAITGLNLDDYGTTGTTLVGNVGTMGTTNLNPSVGALLDSASGAFAYYAANSQRSTSALDNLSAVTIPEPSTLALLGTGIVLLARRRRFHQKR